MPGQFIHLLRKKEVLPMRKKHRGRRKLGQKKRKARKKRRMKK